jgi:hypothetical protein
MLYQLSYAGPEGLIDGLTEGQALAPRMVPGARIELALCCQNRILSPARLPVPPSRRGPLVYRTSSPYGQGRSGLGTRFQGDPDHHAL